MNVARIVATRARRSSARGVLRAIVPAAAIAAAGIPTAAMASLGTGIQSSPVVLHETARPGASYELPGVYVLNTGDDTQTYGLRIQRMSSAHGLDVPPSWIVVEEPRVTLAPHQGATLPLSLHVPATAQPGTYATDVVAGTIGSAGAGTTTLGAAAATGLSFTVDSGGWSVPWPPAPIAAAAAVVLLVLLGVLAARRAGLRLRVERR